jgi:hypothetical protein
MSGLLPTDGTVANQTPGDLEFLGVRNNDNRIDFNIGLRAVAPVGGATAAGACDRGPVYRRLPTLVICYRRKQ